MLGRCLLGYNFLFSVDSGVEGSTVRMRVRIRNRLPGSWDGNILFHSVPSLDLLVSFPDGPHHSRSSPSNNIYLPT